jgi:transaldolase
MTTTTPNTSAHPANKPGSAIKLFADGAKLEHIVELAANPAVSGFTTNPSLMRSSGVTDYRAFAHDILAQVKDKPISFEVFADDHEEMYRQACEIASWGTNVYVKIPVTNTHRDPSYDLVRRLTQQGICVNVTAIFTLEQVKQTAAALEGGAPSVISVFAGRIADTGRDPVPHMRQAVETAARAQRAEVLWASSREVLNLYQAEAAGCHIITMTPDLLAKLALKDKDLDEYSLETVQAFFNDAARSGYSL